MFGVDPKNPASLIWLSPQAAEYGEPEDTERRVGESPVPAGLGGSRKTHRELQGKQEGRLGHFGFSRADASVAPVARPAKGEPRRRPTMAGRSAPHRPTA